MQPMTGSEWFIYMNWPYAIWIYCYTHLLLIWNRNACWSICCQLNWYISLRDPVSQYSIDYYRIRSMWKMNQMIFIVPKRTFTGQWDDAMLKETSSSPCHGKSRQWQVVLCSWLPDDLELGHWNGCTKVNKQNAMILSISNSAITLLVIFLQASWAAWQSFRP